MAYVLDKEAFMAAWGVDPTTLRDQTGQVKYPDVVPGRILNIDGDFLAYQVSADDEKSVEEMKHNHDVAVETLRLMAGAERAVCHLTGSAGDKGRRFEIAIQKEYQGNRKDKIKPKFLHYIKNWMVNQRGAITHVDQEADDGLAQANVQALDNGTPELSVLCSKDKDLQMVPGNHLDWELGDLVFVEGYGHIELDRSKSSPKIVGKGPAFFWAQMLTGDTADNIKGLPTVPGSVLNIVKPTEQVLSAQTVLGLSTSTEAQRTRARNILDARKPGPCGAVTAADILARVSNNKDAFELVKALYKKHGETVGFTHWSTGESVPWNVVFLSEAKLLWMRHYKDENDVLRFFKKECV